MSFFSSRQRIMIEGIMPERALLRLRRAKIDLFDIKKQDKNRILFSVNKKDSEKVFAIYPSVCYNKDENATYVACKKGETGVAKWCSRLKNRVGITVGALLFLCTVLAADSFVFGVEFIGTDVYRREVYAALESGGIKLFAPYKKGKEDLVCAKVLALDGVEYCSVKKSGLKVVVEVRLSPFARDGFDGGTMTAKHTGTIRSISVLKGTALKKKGDEVLVGEPLVGNWFSTENGEQVRVEPIARACIACTYENVIEAATREEAFATAYLALGLSDGDKIEEKTVTETENKFHVKIVYTVIEKINL